MSEIIDLETRRLEKENAEYLVSNSISPRPSVRWRNALVVFLSCSDCGKGRQLQLLYKILMRYRLQTPLSRDEMTDMLICYAQEHAEYLEKKAGLSREFDYDQKPDLENNKIWKSLR